MSPFSALCRVIGSASCCSPAAADGVDDSLVQFTELPSTMASAEVDEHGAATYHFYIAETSAPNLHPVQLPAGVDLFHIGTLGIVLEPMASSLEAMVQSIGSRCSRRARRQLPASSHR